jgi:hypothetical protein
MVEMTENLNFGVTGDCKNIEAAVIECSSHNTSGVTSNPIASIDVTVDPGPSSTTACKVGNKPGICQTKVFTIS